MTRLFSVLLGVYWLCSCQQTMPPAPLVPPTAPSVAEHTRYLDSASAVCEDDPQQAYTYTRRAWALLEKTAPDSVLARLTARMLIEFSQYPLVEDSVYQFFVPKISEWRARYPFLEQAIVFNQLRNAPDSAVRAASVAVLDSLLERGLDPEVAIYFCDAQTDFFGQNNFEQQTRYALRLDSLLQQHRRRPYADMLSAYQLYFAHKRVWQYHLANADLERASALLHRATRILDGLSVTDSLLRYDAEFSQFSIAATKGDFYKALEINQQSLPLVPKRSRLPMAAHLAFATKFQLSLHAYRAAIASAQTILALEPDEEYSGTQREFYRALAYANLSSIYLKMRDTAAARAAFDSLRRIPVNPNASFVVRAHAELLRADRRLPEAKVLFRQQLDKERAVYGDLHNSLHLYYLQLGKVCAELGEYAEALGHLQQGLRCVAPEFAVEKDPYKQPAFAQIWFPHRAIPLLRAKVETLQKLDSIGTLAAQSELAELAVQCLEAELNTLERENSKREFIRNAFAVYELGIEAAFAQYQQSRKMEHLQRAFVLAERSKSILLGQALREENAAQFAGIPDSLIRAEKRLEVDIAFYEQEARSATELDHAQRAERYAFQFRRQLDTLKQQLERDYPKYFALKYQRFDISLEQVQRAVGADALIEFFEGTRSVYVFAISEDSAAMSAYPRTPEYDQPLRAYRHALSSTAFLREQPNESYRILTEMGGHLYQTYLAPNLLGKRQFIFVPDGHWNYIPFEALPVVPATGEQGDFKRIGYWLLHAGSMRYEYSASLWLERRQKQVSSGNGRILAFAPTYDSASTQPRRRGLNPLAATQDEVAFLQKRFEGEFAFGAEASEAAFKEKAADFGVLHLAMHGLVDEENPQFSSLAFTEVPGKEDNLLCANEIKSLDLRAELVVLSACETGVGQYQSGEGVMSLGRSFMYAGAPCVVMTLWSVNDRASQVLVTDFYENLMRRPLDVALRDAKHGYLQQAEGLAAHPLFWAAFVQIGESGANGSVRLAYAVWGSWWRWGLAAALGVGVLVWALRRKAK